jgi:hypothetical protein
MRGDTMLSSQPLQQQPGQLDVAQSCDLALKKGLSTDCENSSYTAMKLNIWLAVSLLVQVLACHKEEAYHRLAISLCLTDVLATV